MLKMKANHQFLDILRRNRKINKKIKILRDMQVLNNVLYIIYSVVSHRIMNTLNFKLISMFALFIFERQFFP
jgi:hypothetical protein